MCCPTPTLTREEIEPQMKTMMKELREKQHLT
jgi:hypothetical protein